MSIPAKSAVPVASYQYPFVRPRIPRLAEIEPELDVSRSSGFFTNFAPASLRLEQAVEQSFLSGSCAVTAGNCTAALTAALIATRRKGPVLVPAFTFPATVSAVRGAGLAPIVGDVDPMTGVLDPGALDHCIRTHGCDAVIVVRPYGIWSDLGELAEICRRAGVVLIIDNAAGLGVAREVVARFAVEDAIEAFSLHATKPFGVGEGGLISCPSPLVANIRSALNFGLWMLGDLKPGEGINGKMDDVTAAMAIVVGRHLPARIRERQRMAALYNRWALKAGLETFVAPGEEGLSPWQCFALRLPEGVSAAGISAHCAAAGLSVRRYYHPPVSLSSVREPIRNAERLSERALCLPVYDGEDVASAGDIWAIFIEGVRLFS
ncbi:DegT/DnrJ/EryC1/StrS family aminotransferase [Ancylobacter sp. A5.8]|uniref:aminotransferase class I/II-fold pyridoxal phosphate-dependent enzyme n=1 Tax=Ancylobacter gelatini TaxID=2919920 RepID=UPI001F4D7F36|nr:aminotransferase class I/II-fold pyridoxal phosphate-dependent enzyme [Ancylobacter gelatini]MCJ8142811.1 DegT/DnrJ/EryC1/StrS family aminotransferase [Ancylobacter gelatini]